MRVDVHASCTTLSTLSSLPTDTTGGGSQSHEGSDPPPSTTQVSLPDDAQPLGDRAESWVAPPEVGLDLMCGSGRQGALALATGTAQRSTS